jgi:hypothetical protein
MASIPVNCQCAPFFRRHRAGALFARLDLCFLRVLRAFVVNLLIFNLTPIQH